METEIQLPRRSEFYFSNPENCIVVENRGNHVRIHAMRDNFSEQRRRFFIRHLVAEGFIPDKPKYTEECEAQREARIRWVVGPQRMADTAKARKRWKKILLRFLLVAAMGLAGVMGAMALAGYF